MAITVGSVVDLGTDGLDGLTERRMSCGKVRISIDWLAGTTGYSQGPQ